MRRKAPGVPVDIQTGDKEMGHADTFAARGAGRSSTLASSSGPGLGAGLGRAMAVHDGGAPLTPSAYQTPDQEETNAQPNQGHGRRWFNLGRVTNHK
ncbi:hypothetical protein M406DRAFT_322002 [Cryphonectria parasitica EP155]|uniref:Uncharacterized protein n=1 Tax=Cryphonectria parasitica (strain ATCC 38755 / EP155) TaxID=660469 RepID=A0A9P4Y234_CRYP1|nr:uncharacterized protein M406DRAFT_322002 [Cryphonectria parasitica EP155]KAF3765579.1 hypothetical protein M406DRAFT_322002 [Cryphonectria parasitica EP155]